VQQLDLATGRSRRVVELEKAFWSLAPGGRRLVARFQGADGCWRLRLYEVE